MVLENLTPVGAMVISLAILIALLYYILYAGPAEFAEPHKQVSTYFSLLDDDLLYLTSPTIAYHDCAYSSILPLHMARSAGGQPAHPLLFLSDERQEAIQLA